MFGEAGHFYIYLTYGMHWMLNIVTGKKNYPAVVLIRGLAQPEAGKRSDLEISRGPASRRLDGPGKLTKFLKIDGHFNNKIASRKTGLWLEDRGINPVRGREGPQRASASNGIKRTPRIGVDYAGPVWSQKHYRFLLKNFK